MTIKLISSPELAKILDISRQAVNEAARKGWMEAPAYTIGGYKGWTAEQVERIKIKKGVSK